MVAAVPAAGFLEARRAQLAGMVLRERRASLFAAGTGSQFQVFSQNGEDAVLLWILQETGPPMKTFVEIGIQNARECNTALLAFVLGWDGVMLEADPLGVAGAPAFDARTMGAHPASAL